MAMPDGIRGQRLWLGLIESFVALGALPAGWLLILSPDGSRLGVPVEILGDGPFPDFLIPGILLFTVNGLMQLGGAWLTFARHPLAGKAGWVLGILLMGWIGVQVAMIGLGHWLQPFYFLLGLAEALLGYRLSGRGSKNQASA